MAEWRFLRGWTEAELETRLNALEQAPLNFAAPLEDLPGNRWRRYFTEAVIAQEPPGAPAPGGAFAKAWLAVLDYQFSDPSIVKAHFDPRSPFEGRTLLLELRIFGLHFLCGTRITRLTERTDPGVCTERGFRYDTLAGHFEVGSEWFMLTQDQRTGEVRFRIQASWRPGTFPNFWSRWGFWLFGERFQLAWHRLAYLRLRKLSGATGNNLARVPQGRRLVHAGSDLADPTLWSLQAPLPVLGATPSHESRD